MMFGIHRRRRTPSPPQPVYIVSSGHDVEQVFATRKDAEGFASQNLDARVSVHHLRRSVDEAVVIFDRTVIVERGAKVLDRTHVVRRFIDNPRDQPVRADVEWFHDASDSRWHIAGFGIDQAELDTRIQTAIDQVRQLSRAAAPMEGAR